MKHTYRETYGTTLPGEFPPVCKGCNPPVRYLGCHAECEKYLTAKAEYRERKKKEKQSWAMTESGMRSYLATPGGDYTIKKRWRGKKGVWDNK